MLLPSALLLVAGMTGCASEGGDLADTRETTTTTTITTSPERNATTTEEAPWTYGDDPGLDALWDGCEAGDAAACDELYAISPVGSDYEAFGSTCGGRTDGGGCDGATDGSEQPPEGTGDELDVLCEVAVAAIAEIPTGGFDSSDFALEETAVAQILYGLSDDLSAAGAADLSSAVRSYADARSDLALAYEQERSDEVNAAQVAAGTAAEGVVAAASTANAPACTDIAG
jgi:hypothetical protein